MDNFIKDIKKNYFFKNNNYLINSLNINFKLTVNNIFYIEEYKINKFINNIYLIEKWAGLKFYRITFNYKNIFLKNRFLTLLVRIKYKLNDNYAIPLLNYIIVHALILSFILNIFNTKRLFFTVNKYQLNDVNKTIFFNLKLPYDYLSFTNKKKYKKIMREEQYFDNRIWLHFYLYVNYSYIRKNLFNLLEDIKSIWF